MVRTTIELDEEADRLRRMHDLNLSKLAREAVKEKYGGLPNLEARRDELEAAKARIREEIHERERRVDEIDEQLARLNNGIQKNRVIQELEAKDEYRIHIKRAVQEVKFVKGRDRIPVAKDAETGQPTDWEPAPEPDAVKEQQASMIAEEIGFEKTEVQEALEVYLQET